MIGFLFRLLLGTAILCFLVRFLVALLWEILFDEDST